MARKPSHFGSKLRAPSGRSFTGLASIGAIGGNTGSRIVTRAASHTALPDLRNAALDRARCDLPASPSFLHHRSRGAELKEPRDPTDRDAGHRAGRPRHT